MFGELLWDECISCSTMKGWNWLGGPLSKENVDVFGEFVLSRVSSVFDWDSEAGLQELCDI